MIILTSMFCEIQCCESINHVNIFHYSEASASSETPFGHLIMNIYSEETSISQFVVQNIERIINQPGFYVSSYKYITEIYAIVMTSLN